MSLPTLTAAQSDVSGRFAIACLSSQPWEVDLPTNRQQIMRRAARRGHPVLFVETGGFLGIHLLRLLWKPNRRSLLRRLLSSEEVEPGVRVRKALNVVPWRQKHKLSRRVNSALTSMVVERCVRGLNEPVVAWIYDPVAAPSPRARPFAFSVYDCVDDYAEQVAEDPRRRAGVEAADRRAARTSRLVFATTESLYDRHRRLNSHTFVVPNAADHGHFAVAADRAACAEEVRDLRRPVIGFAGNFLPSKVDFDLLRRLARSLSEWTFLLIGPPTPGTGKALAELARFRNVVWLGGRPYADLPRYVAAFDVAMIPYLSNAYTRSCFPLKAYEFLAAGKPVVASGLPSLEGMEPDIVLAEGVDDFIAAVGAALGRDTDEDKARRKARSARNTWETRAARLLELTAGEVYANSGSERSVVP